MNGQNSKVNSSQAEKQSHDHQWHSKQGSKGYGPFWLDISPAILISNLGFGSQNWSQDCVCQDTGEGDWGHCQNLDSLWVSGFSNIETQRKCKDITLKQIGCDGDNVGNDYSKNSKNVVNNLVASVCKSYSISLDFQLQIFYKKYLPSKRIWLLLTKRYLKMIARCK